MTIIISNTEISTKDLCDKKHDYMYNQELEPRNYSLSIRRGQVGHKMLEVYFSSLRDGFSHRDAVEFSLEEHLRQFNDCDPGDAESINMLLHLKKLMVQYFDYYALDVDMFKIIAVEKNYATPISSNIYFGMIVDLIVEHRTGSHRGSVDIIDHKFVNNFRSPDDLRLDGQQPKYIKTAQANGLPIRNAYLNQIRYRSLKDPSPSDLFRRSPLLSSKEAIDNVWSDARDTAIDIVSEKNYDTPPNYRRRQSYTSCRSCFFKKLCMTEQSGEDTTLMRKIDFKKRTRPLKNWINSND